MHRTDSEPAAPPSGRRWVKDSTCAPGRGLAAVLSRSGRGWSKGPKSQWGITPARMLCSRQVWGT